ncbi:MAG: putative lipid II flippase FtsW [Fimbriimonadaceae bacterium]|nr:putative lipid II flippase FtsW [Fimbriimonadaceae bacterium]
MDRGSPVGQPKLWQRIDVWLVVSAAILLFFGLTSLYSFDHGRGERNFIDQAVRVIIGFGPFLLFLLVDYRFWRRIAVPMYVLNVGLLALVVVMGSQGGGAQRWLNIGPIEFQPSEMTKLLMTLTLATFFANRLDRIRSVWTFGASFLHVLPSLVLVFAQPHLGATLVLIVTWLAVSWFMGVPGKFIIGAIALAAALLVFSVKTPGILSDYQLKRLEGMVVSDERGKGYQQMRASLAFGVGGVSGSGFLKGEQKAAGNIPEQRTDFIFTIIGEEGGLVGSTLVLAAFLFFFYRIWLVTYQAPDEFGRGIAAGILSVLGFHTVVNLGMNLQLTPVVGLWLPWMSYGGTAIWLCMACLGLLLSIRLRTDASMFS